MTEAPQNDSLTPLNLTRAEGMLLLNILAATIVEAEERRRGLSLRVEPDLYDHYTEMIETSRLMLSRIHNRITELI
jgi:hypothetical protein